MITMEIKQLFFDKGAVLRAVDKAKRAVLSKAGAFIRTTAMQSILPKKGPAPPGRPPHSHTGLLRRFIFFGYDPDNESVVIGPARFSRGTDAPHILEFGGTATVRRSRRVRKTRKVRVEPRPYMEPAMEKELPKFTSLWRWSVRP